MQKKLLIPILVVLVIVIVLITRGCGEERYKAGSPTGRTAGYGG